MFENARMPSELPPTFVSGFHDEATVRKMPYRQLGNTDMRVSVLSFGASSLGGVFRETADEESVALVEEAIKGGINYIDTAPWYGQGRSEQVLGRALAGIPRKSYYLATKVGRYEKDVGKMFNFSKKKIVESVKESLGRLGLEYIDVIQVHDMEFCESLEQIVKHTLPALQELKNTGLVRHIGVTGYSVRTLKRVVSLYPGIDTVLSYCRATLIDKTLLEEGLDFFHSYGVAVVNASPVAMGLLSHRGAPDWHPAIDKTKDLCKEAASYCNENGHNVTDLAVLWSLALAQIPTTLISTASQVNLRKNLDLARATLTASQTAFLQQLQDKFFKYAVLQDWENVEIARYWTEMDQAGEKQITDL